MATIVRIKEGNKKYVLLGTGFGAYKSTRPSFFGGNLFPSEEEGTIGVVAVADEIGNILWVEADEIKVIEIDGVKIEDVMSSHR